MHSATPTVCFVGWFTLRGSVESRLCVREPSWNRQVPRAPLPEKRSTAYQRDVVHLLRGHYPSFIARTDSCARPVAFTDLWPNLVPVIFAGCYRPLLVNRSFPDVISASPSQDAWAPTTTVCRLHLPVTSPATSAFPKRAIGRRTVTFR